MRTAPQVTTAGPVGTAPAAIQTPGNVTGATAIEVQRAPDREANRNIVTRPSPTFVKTGYFQKNNKTNSWNNVKKR